MHKNSITTNLGQWTSLIRILHALSTHTTRKTALQFTNVEETAAVRNSRIAAVALPVYGGDIIILETVS